MEDFVKQLRPYQQEALNKLRQRLKEKPHPLLVNASVGAGKSLILSELILGMERAGFHVLCLTLNSTLIQQNAETYQLQNGHGSIYCAGLKSKCCKNLVVFASPNSVCQGIRNKDEISTKPFNLIVIDEAHNINKHSKNSMYMRILNHYGFLAQQEQRPFRIVGLTGTPYRNKGESIVGVTQLFQEEVCNISTQWLIENNYLVPPKFGITRTEGFDFSELRIEKTGRFNHKDIENITTKNMRLTGKIMHEVVSVIESGRNGAFIFASTVKHAEECMRHLPSNSAMITGNTKHEERKQILIAAKEGKIQYLVNVATLLVGVDVPNFDVCAWLRPTESLTLYIQGIGRVLRLHPSKTDCIVLDYAGNLDRHGDIDHPIINNALQPREDNAKDYCIPCYTCHTNNTIHARRCIGVINNKRCEHYFEFKDCPSCGIKNDITARHCRECGHELIDPNAKLRHGVITYELKVGKAEYWISVHGQNSYPVFNCKYTTNDKDVFECFMTNSERAKNVFYAKCIRLHFEKASLFYPYLQRLDMLQKLVAASTVKTPHTLICSKDEYGRYSVIKKLF